MNWLARLALDRPGAALLATGLLTSSCSVIKLRAESLVEVRGRLVSASTGEPVGYPGRLLEPGLQAMQIEPFAALTEYLGLQIGGLGKGREEEQQDDRES